MKKIGKNNPLEEEIKKDNEVRTRWNETVDQAVIAEVPELEIIRVKQEHITAPVVHGRKGIYGKDCTDKSFGTAGGCLHPGEDCTEQAEGR